MDAIYRTTKHDHDLPLFFVCVKTNCNYVIVAEFIVGSEGIDVIAEALFYFFKFLFCVCH